MAEFWFQFPSQVHTVPLLHLSHAVTCVCATGTKFGTNQTSTDVYEQGLSYLSICVFNLGCGTHSEMSVCESKESSKYSYHQCYSQTLAIAQDTRSTRVA